MDNILPESAISSNIIDSLSKYLQPTTNNSEIEKEIEQDTTSITSSSSSTITENSDIQVPETIEEPSTKERTKKGRWSLLMESSFNSIADMEAVHGEREKYFRNESNVTIIYARNDATKEEIQQRNNDDNNISLLYDDDDNNDDYDNTNSHYLSSSNVIDLDSSDDDTEQPYDTKINTSVSDFSSSDLREQSHETKVKTEEKPPKPIQQDVTQQQQKKKFNDFKTMFTEFDEAPRKERTKITGFDFPDAHKQQPQELSLNMLNPSIYASKKQLPAATSSGGVAKVPSFLSIGEIKTTKKESHTKPKGVQGSPLKKTGKTEVPKQVSLHNESQTELKSTSGTSLKKDDKSEAIKQGLPKKTRKDPSSAPSLIAKGGEDGKTEKLKASTRKKLLKDSSDASGLTTKSDGGDISKTSTTKRARKDSSNATSLTTKSDGVNIEAAKSNVLKRPRAEIGNENEDDLAAKRQKGAAAEAKLLESVSTNLEQMKKNVSSELNSVKLIIAEMITKPETIIAKKKEVVVAAEEDEQQKPEGKRSSACSLMPPKPAAPITQDIKDLMKKIKDMNAPITASLMNYEKEYGDTERRELSAQKVEQEKKLKVRKDKLQKARDKLEEARTKMKELESTKPHAGPNTYFETRNKVGELDEKLKGSWDKFMQLKNNVNFTIKEATRLKAKLNNINTSTIRSSTPDKGFTASSSSSSSSSSDRQPISQQVLPSGVPPLYQGQQVTQYAQHNYMLPAQQQQQQQQQQGPQIPLPPSQPPQPPQLPQLNYGQQPYLGYLGQPSPYMNQQQNQFIPNYSYQPNAKPPTQ